MNIFIVRIFYKDADSVDTFYCKDAATATLCVRAWMRHHWPSNAERQPSDSLTEDDMRWFWGCAGLTYGVSEEPILSPGDVDREVIALDAYHKELLNG